MLRTVLAALLVASPAVATEQPPLVFINYPMVHKVSCFEGSGTAFRIGRNHWLSVAHVTSLHGCEIDGEPITVTEQNGAKDFSRIDTSTSRSGMKVNCHGFVPGHWYWAVGYAKGLPFQTAVATYATYARTPDGRRVLIGDFNVIPGMSGGPILNEAGEVVGLVNAYVPDSPISLSRDLRDTSVCGADIA